MIVCQECGNSAASKDGFCSACGVLLEWSGEMVAAPQGPVAASGQGDGGRTPHLEAVRPPPLELVEQPAYDGLFCSECGTRNAEGKLFCRYCGSGLDIVVPSRDRRSWWRKLFSRPVKAPTAAGARPDGFRTRLEVVGATPAATAVKKRRRLRMPSSLPLSRIAPILIVLGLVGIGIGPGRQWATQHLSSVLGQAKAHVSAKYVPVVPLSATASSTAKGHKPALAIDGVIQTWWQSADHPQGIGESITIKFANPVSLDRIGLLSGVAGDKYRSQARPRTITVTADGKPAGQISFEDKADFQNAALALRGVTTVTFVVTASYPGQAGHAVAVRELQFFELQS
ncbi:zinc ribbon domain-containing protein [soil metagenome]|jgi:hypothetical protein